MKLPRLLPSLYAFRLHRPLGSVANTRLFHSSISWSAAGAGSSNLLDLNLNSVCDRNNVLVCGDGDLSYALALAIYHSNNNNLNKLNLTATTFQTGEMLAAMHPFSTSNISELEKLAVNVKTGVDATKLHTQFKSKYFHKIVWNFPQHPERKKIQRHRQLLKDFFASARSCLREDGEVWVTLKAGQGGSKAELAEYERLYSNTWQVQEQAALSNLVLACVSEANISSLEEAGYRSVGFRGSDRSFFTKGSLTHIFTFPEQVKVLNFSVGEERDASGSSGVIMHPLVYRHDISFWVNEDKFIEGEFDKFLKRTMEPKEIDFRFEHFDSYVCPKSGRTSRGYHVDLWSHTQPLTKPLTSDIMREVSISLSDGFNLSISGEEAGDSSSSGAMGRYQFELLPDHCKPKKLKQGDTPN